MNLMAISYGDTCLVVDAGVSFPDVELLGIDLVIPDLTYLQQRRVSALVLTHGHEDHIGAVPYLLPYVDGPVFGTALTLALVRPSWTSTISPTTPCGPSGRRTSSRSVRSGSNSCA
jgi:ribonuclease J